jgi:hypothetical protein
MVITLPEYKDYAGFKTTNSDPSLQITVDYVNDFIERFCNTKFSLQQVLNERHHVVDGLVVLKHAPVISVVEVLDTVKNTPVSGWYLENEEGIITDIAANRVSVSYEFGYAAAPAGLKIPAFELVTYFNKREFNKSQTIGATGESMTFTDTKTIPAHIRAGLELYRVL